MEIVMVLMAIVAIVAGAKVWILVKAYIERMKSFEKIIDAHLSLAEEVATAARNGFHPEEGGTWREVACPVKDNHHC